MSRWINVMITSAGRRVSLVKFFIKELSGIFGERARLYTTDLDPETSSACRHSHHGIKVGRFSSPDYMEQLLNICMKYKVGLVVPTIDTELLLLSKSHDDFEKRGVKILVSDEEFVRICRDKRMTNKFFTDRGIPVPAIQDRKKPKFPVFIKPIDGSSSKEIYFIDSPSKISPYLRDNPKFMWMEYIPRDEYVEYTVDMYYNKNGYLCCAVPRVRIAVRGGETNKGITNKDSFLINYLRERLGHIKGARGCITLQLFYGKNNKKIYGIEINPRFGGGFPLSYLAGANFPKWIIKEYLLEEDVCWFDGWEDRLLLLRYDNEMIVHDFDYKF